MTPHPSLTAPPAKIDPIKPVEKMARNDFCWCQSGLKYKKCHLDREQQTPINIFEVEAQMISELRDGYCSHPNSANDPCSSKIIKAHTIQKNGGLAAIAEAGHVLTVKPTMKDLVATQGKPSPRKIGVNNASVFPGFCGKHDDALFKPIEGRFLSLTKETAFLFSYRAIAYERFAKEAQLRTSSVQRDMDRGHPFATQVAVQKHLTIFINGIRMGIRDVSRWKSQFDERLLSGDLDDFHFLVIRFNELLPIVACCAFHPEFDLQGKPLQRLGRTNADLDHVTLTVTVFEGRTVMVLGWIGVDDGPAREFAESFLKVEDLRKADALIRLLFIHTDNLFLRPSWWDALPSSDRKAFNTMTLSGTTVRMRSGREIADDERSFVNAGVIETVSG